MLTLPAGFDASYDMATGNALMVANAFRGVRRQSDGNAGVMTAPGKTEPVVRILLLAGWIAFWFWAFSSADSDGFFLYHHHFRIPIFAAALLAATLIPISAAVQWRRYHKTRRSGLRSLITHSTTCLIVLAAFLAVFCGLSAAERPWRPEA